MARPAIGSEIRVVAIRVALRTVGTDVRAREREIGIGMIKGRGFPTTGRVTREALVRELISGVIRFINLLKICIMTRPAVGRRAGVLASGVALRAGCRNVGTGQREVRKIMIKGSGLPAVSGVALRTILAVLSGFVIRIVGACVVRLVTAPAIVWSTRVLAISVTGCTAHTYMSARQREITQIVIEACLRPRLRSVTLLTVMV